MKKLLFLLIPFSWNNGFSQRVPDRTIEAMVKINSLDNELIPLETRNKIRTLNAGDFYDRDKNNKKLMEINGVWGNNEYELVLADNKITGIIKSISYDSLIRTVYRVNIPVNLWCCTPSTPGHKKHSCTMTKIKETTEKENCIDWAPCN